jgi:hypothetical protein
MDKDDPGLFPLGRKIVSKNALAVLGEAGVNPSRLFERHAEGDWGVIESKSWCLNRMAVDSGYGCVASAYAVLGEVRVAILTLADRSNTLMALSDEIEKLLGVRPP